MNQKEKLAKVTKKGVRFSRIGAMSVGAKIAIVVLALVVVISFLAPYISPYTPEAIAGKCRLPPVSTSSERTTWVVTSWLACCTAAATR